MGLPRDPPLPSMEAEHRATVAARFVAGVLSGVRDRGADPATLLAQAGLTREHLVGPRRTPIESYAALYNLVVETLGDEGFGLFSTRLRPGTFEFLCRGVVSSPTLGEALERAARYLDVVLPDLEVRLERPGRFARLRIRERRRLRTRANDPRRVFAFEWLLRLLHGLACWLTARSLVLESVAFPYPRPEHAAEYARVYTERSSFGATALEATLDGTLLDLPVRRGDADLAQFLVGAPGKIAMLYRPDRQVARAVREALSMSLHEPMGLEQLARSLHLSPRSLHRRLANEGTGVRAIRDGLRLERAKQLLEKTDESIAGIASALGYSEPSAFFRAFVGWTGSAPTMYRKRNTFAKKQHVAD